MPFFSTGEVTIHYETLGNGFPLLLLPPGGMKAEIAAWGRAAFNPVEIFSREYMVVALDERNAGQWPSARRSAARCGAATSC
jgi:hypothetical protein